MLTTEELRKNINEAISLNNKSRFPERIGSSIIGDPCERKIALNFYWAEKEELGAKKEIVLEQEIEKTRLHMLFEQGHNQEEIIANHIKNAGYKVKTIDEKTGKQYEANALNGHIVSKVDGILTHEGKEYLLEFKTANEANYKQLIKAQSVLDWKEGYYNQVQLSMGLFNIESCIFIVFNKNNASLYLEKIEAKSVYFHDLIAKAKNILNLEKKNIDLLERVSNKKDSFACKFCNVKEVCYKEKVPLKNCRTCSFSEPETFNEQNATKWRCKKKEVVLNKKEQETACDSFTLSPSLSF